LNYMLYITEFLRSDMKAIQIPNLGEMEIIEKINSKLNIYALLQIPSKYFLHNFSNCCRDYLLLDWVATEGKVAGRVRLGGGK